MLTRRLVLTAAAFAAVPAARAEERFALYDARGFTEALASGRPVVVHLHAEW